MKQLLLPMLLVACSVAFSQQQTFDIINFTPPKDWQKKTAEGGGGLQFSTEDAAKGTYCIFTLFKAIPATANAKNNFDAAWTDLVKGMVTVSADPKMTEPATEEGWEAQSGYAPFESEGTKGVVVLVTSTGFGKMINIIILTNTDVYEKEMTAFLESVSFQKENMAPEKTSDPVNTTVTPVTGDFAFTSTNFDDGWRSVIQDDWVFVSKDDIKVYLWYALQYNASDFSGTGVVDRDYYWDNYVSKYFTIETKQYKDNGEVLGSLKPSYVEGWATDKQTGERRFIGMRLDISPNTAYITIGSAKDEESLWKQFPKANGGAFSPSDLSNMGGYNKFAITANDVLGTWQDGNTSTAQWYYVTPSGYEGYAGMTVAARSATFNFNEGGNYTSIHNGATGAVGNMSTFQQNYKGKYTVSNWNLTATNRFNGKTDNFEAWFVAIRGGRILKLRDGGMDYSLVKTK
jgi:hypothetical protein